MPKKNNDKKDKLSAQDEQDPLMELSHTAKMPENPDFFVDDRCHWGPLTNLSVEYVNDISFLRWTHQASFGDSFHRKKESSSEDFSSSVLASTALSSSTRYIIQSIRKQLNNPPLPRPEILDQKSDLGSKRSIHVAEVRPTKNKCEDESIQKSGSELLQKPRRPSR